MGCHCESRSVQRTATGLLGVVGVVGGRGFERRLQAFHDGSREFRHLGAQTLVLTNVAFRMPLHPDPGGTASLGPRRYCAHIPALISHVSVSLQGLAAGDSGHLGPCPPCGGIRSRRVVAVHGQRYNG